MARCRRHGLVFLVDDAGTLLILLESRNRSFAPGARVRATKPAPTLWMDKHISQTKPNKAGHMVKIKLSRTLR